MLIEKIGVECVALWCLKRKLKLCGGDGRVNLRWIESQLAELERPGSTLGSCQRKWKQVDVAETLNAGGWRLDS